MARSAYYCPECKSTGLAESQVKAGKLARRHNESRHGGRDVAYPTTVDD